MTTIEVVRRQVAWGNVVMDPANDAARVLLRISGRKTLTPRVLRDARTLGLKVELVSLTEEPDQQVLEEFIHQQKEH